MEQTAFDRDPRRTLPLPNSNHPRINLLQIGVIEVGADLRGITHDVTKLNHGFIISNRPSTQRRLLGDSDGGLALGNRHRSQVDDGLRKLVLGQAVLLGQGQVSTQLLADEAGDGAEAAVARRKPRARPDVAEQHLVSQRHQLGAKTPIIR
jgi:hypothetical protein